MSLKLFTTQEKLREIEWLIQEDRKKGHRADVLKAIAVDLRARIDSAPSILIVESERRIAAIARAKAKDGYDPGALMKFGEFMYGRWPLVKQAVELFGAQVEEAARTREGQST